MTRFPIASRLVLAALAPVVLAGCEAQPETSARAAGMATTDPAIQARDAALTQREEAQLDWLKKTLEAPAHAEVYKAALEQARGRATHCSGDDCRRRALDRREARLDFADGKGAMRGAMPFGSGRFARAEGGYAGPVRIVPLMDGKAMLVVALTFKGRPACALDGVMMRDDGDAETWTVTSLDQDLPRLVLTPDGTDSFALSYADPGHQPYDTDYCGVGTSIDGRYAVAR